LERNRIRGAHEKIARFGIESRAAPIGASALRGTVQGAFERGRREHRSDSVFAHLFLREPPGGEIVRVVECHALIDGRRRLGGKRLRWIGFFAWYVAINGNGALYDGPNWLARDAINDVGKTLFEVVLGFRSLPHIPEWHPELARNFGPKFSKHIESHVSQERETEVFGGGREPSFAPGW
jgi:hypothetical protein